MTIIGRRYEQKQLDKVFQSSQAEFVAVYGRRRVGKTFLIREFFKEKLCIFFRSSGIHKGSLKKQLEKFKQEIETTFYQGRKGTKLAPFANWHDAFEALKDAIDFLTEKQKVVLFLDELPWMATPKSGLLEALDYYWNRHWSENKRIKLIICGSAASWIIENILHNTGGLYNRVTLRLPLMPFTLNETKAYLQHRKIHYHHQQIVMLYMCLGGIPFYLNFVEKGFSAIQNINAACFSKKGTLYDEFSLLFASLFKKHEIHEAIVKLISAKREGVTRNEIETKLIYKGGRLTKRLLELEEAGFILSFTPLDKERGTYYKITDEYTLFYLTWIAKKSLNRIAQNIDEPYWEILSEKPAWKTWAGYAFEAICFKHIAQLKKALHIPNGAYFSAWRYIANKTENLSGPQIDLVFDRPDNVVNLCEIKYSQTPFVIDKSYAQHLTERENIYRYVRKTKKQIFHSIIAASGLKKNMYSEELIASIATLDDLFK